jgi:hypothetical protein
VIAKVEWHPGEFFHASASSSPVADALGGEADHGAKVLSLLGRFRNFEGSSMIRYNPLDNL